VLEWVAIAEIKCARDHVLVWDQMPRSLPSLYKSINSTTFSWSIKEGTAANAKAKIMLQQQ